jgi:uncharacterized membrane-anchored protein YitT (DUF2179 family)
MEKLTNFLKNRNTKTIVATILGTTIYCMSVVWILDLGGFYAGGLTGLSQLITTALGAMDIKVSISVFVFILNIPMLIIGIRGVSKRFSLLSALSIGLQVLLIYLFEQMVVKGFNPILGLSNDRILLAIIGGLGTGIGCGLCLRSGSSSGGMDILSQYLSIKKNIPFTKISLTLDFIIITLGGLVANDITVAIFTIVRLISHIITLEKIHTIYNYIKITIYTSEKDAMREALIARFNHGITIYEATGGYTNQIKYVFESVVSSYETEEYRMIAKNIDKNVFITYSSISSVYGFFNKNIIV